MFSQQVKTICAQADKVINYSSSNLEDCVLYERVQPKLFRFYPIPESTRLVVLPTNGFKDVLQRFAFCY